MISFDLLDRNSFHNISEDFFAQADTKEEKSDAEEMLLQFLNISEQQ